MLYIASHAKYLGFSYVMYIASHAIFNLSSTFNLLELANSRQTKVEVR